MGHVSSVGLASDILCGVGLGQCKEILAFSRDTTFLRHEVLFSQGAQVETLVVIESGQVKVTHATPDGADIILWIVGPGETVDARIDLDQHACSATAMENSSALVWESHRFLKLRDQFPLIRDNLGGILANRLCELETRFCELAHQSAGQRLANSLLRLVAQTNLDGSNSLSLRVTQEELGKLAGLTVFTISRLLSAWSANGVLEQRRASLVIRNVSSLERLTRASPSGEAHVSVSTNLLGAGFS